MTRKVVMCYEDGTFSTFRDILNRLCTFLVMLRLPGRRTPRSREYSLQQIFAKTNTFQPSVFPGTNSEYNSLAEPIFQCYNFEPIQELSAVTEFCSFGLHQFLVALLSCIVIPSVNLFTFSRRPLMHRSCVRLSLFCNIAVKK